MSERKTRGGRMMDVRGHNRGGELTSHSGPPDDHHSTAPLSQTPALARSHRTQSICVTSQSSESPQSLASVSELVLREMLAYLLLDTPRAHLRTAILSTRSRMHDLGFPLFCPRPGAHPSCDKRTRTPFLSPTRDA